MKIEEFQGRYHWMVLTLIDLLPEGSGEGAEYENE